jgi:hypothetical protein
VMLTSDVGVTFLDEFLTGNTSNHGSAIRRGLGDHGNRTVEDYTLLNGTIRANCSSSGKAQVGIGSVSGKSSMSLD